MQYMYRFVSIDQFEYDSMSRYYLTPISNSILCPRN